MFKVDKSVFLFFVDFIEDNERIERRDLNFFVEVVFYV